MKNKKFLALVFAASMTLVSGCSPYTEYDKDYTMKASIPSISMTLGEARYINLYNLKSPVQLSILAPKGKTIVYDTGEKAKVHILKIEPRSSVAYSFLVEDTNPKDPAKNPLKVLEFSLQTFKNVKIPSNAQEIRERSGKYEYVRGWRLNYSLSPGQVQTEVDLNDFNTMDRHEFNFSGPVSNIDVLLLSPLGSEFLYSNGKTAPTHTIKLDSKKRDSSLYFDLYYKASNSVYQKRIDINFNGVAPTHTAKARP